MATPVWLKNLLKARGIRFEERHHRPAFTAQEVAQREHVSGHRVAKVVAVVADDQPVAAILPASRQIDFTLLAEELGAREARLATEAEMAACFTGCEPGALPALRKWREVAVIMDRSLQVEGEILFQAGTHEDAVYLDFRDWFRLVRPQVATFTIATAPVVLI
jgi:Ala-tRNA(Pro) deacylase